MEILFDGYYGGLRGGIEGLGLRWEGGHFAGTRNVLTFVNTTAIA